MSKNLFITGTGTDIGKTYVTGLIIKKLTEAGKSVAYYKAAMSGNNLDESGCIIPGDAIFVKKHSGMDQPLEEMSDYVYEAAFSPHLAAKIAGKPVDLNKVLYKFDDVCKKYGFVTVEGSGGIVCPLRFDGSKVMLEDFIKARDLPCLIVADAGLGTINAVVLTVEYMKTHDIRVKGIIFNGYEAGNLMHDDNAFMCEALTGLDVVARVKRGDADLDMQLERLISFYD